MLGQLGREGDLTGAEALPRAPGRGELQRGTTGRGLAKLGLTAAYTFSQLPEIAVGW